MRTKRSAMLAGIAAVALLAGAGIASAQQENGTQGQPKSSTQQMNKGPSAGGMTQGANTGGQHATQQHMGQSGAQQQHMGQAGKTNAGNTAERTNGGNTAQKNARNAGERTQAGKTAEKAQAGRTAERGHAGTTAERGKTGRTAERTRTSHGAMASQEERRGSRNATERTRMGRANTGQQYGQRNAAQNGQQGRQQFGERQRNGFEGLQGNAAAGGNVQLSEQQRTQIRSTVLAGRNVPRVGNVDFPVVAGTVIPRGRVHIVPVPSTLVRIEPAWRGYEYFVWNDQLVIVDPHDMRIIAVVYV